MKHIRRTHFKGQDLLEFALLVPFMMLFIMTIFDLGRGTFYYASLNNAAREAARYATIQEHACDSASIEAIVAARAVGMAADDLTINVSWLGLKNNDLTACTADDPGSAMVEVDATYCFTPVTPLSMNTLNGVISLLNDDYIPGNCIDLNSTTTMYLEM